MSESTKCYSILNATINFTAKGEPSRNRVPQGARVRLERHAGKLARAVLRGLEGGNALPATRRAGGFGRHSCYYLQGDILHRQVGIVSGTSLAAYFTNMGESPKRAPNLL